MLAERGPGELLGDLSGIDGQPRSASVTALDEVRGLVVPLRAFRGFLMDHPPRRDLAARAPLAPPARGRGAASLVVGPSTRAVHAGQPSADQGAPVVPGPVLAAPFHLQGEIDAAPYSYGRAGNPTWTAVEAALGALEDAESVLFSSGMAALCAVLEPVLGRRRRARGRVRRLPGRAAVATDRLAPRGVEVRFVPTDTDAIVAACPGATLVWVETPAQPALRVCDIAAVAGAAHAAGARLAVDNTLATPLGQRPLDLGADASMHSATKSLSGHSDLILG